MVIISAVFGLTTVGSAGSALASDPIGFSPSAKVVSRAPMAVSVTFKEPLRDAGASVRILTEDGDVGTGEVTTAQKTLKREIRLGAPAGRYTVEWKVVSAKGRKMSGKFSFQAARGNDEVGRTSPVSRPTVSPEPDPIATAEVVTPEWLENSEPLWTAQPTDAGTPPGTSTGGSGFTVVPLTVGGLLVLAAGMVSLINKPRLRN